MPTGGWRRELDQDREYDPLVAVPPRGVGLGRSHGVAVTGLAVDALPLVPVHGVVAEEHHGTSGEQVVEHEAHQNTAECQPGPGCAGQNALVIGAVSGCQMAECAEQVGDGSSPGGDEGRDQQCRETLVGGAGEVKGQNRDQRMRFGW